MDLTHRYFYRKSWHHDKNARWVTKIRQNHMDGKPVHRRIHPHPLTIIRVEPCIARISVRRVRSGQGSGPAGHDRGEDGIRSAGDLERRNFPLFS